MTGLQDVVQEWKNAPPASTLPQPSFALSLSVRLEEGVIIVPDMPDFTPIPKSMTHLMHQLHHYP